MNEMNRSCGCQQNHACNCAPANTCNCQPMPCMPSPGCFESCCKVMEAPICHQPEFHHFHKVEHIVPVYINNLHHHHTHHEYQTQQQQTFESLGYDYYHQNPAVAQAAMPMVNQPMMAAPANQMMQPNMMGGQQMMPNGMVAGQQMMQPNSNANYNCACAMTQTDQMGNPTALSCDCQKQVMSTQYPQMF